MKKKLIETIKLTKVYNTNRYQYRLKEESGRQYIVRRPICQSVMEQKFADIIEEKIVWMS